MRVAMVLPGLGRVQRGAETAFLELARALDERPEVQVELFGSGLDGVGDLRVHVIPCAPRERFERWPKIPAFRSDCHYEEFSFARNFLRSGLYRPDRFDVVLGCTYPHVNWALRRAGRKRGPKIVFATQNGDWPCRSTSREFRFFRCDGLVCTNPQYYEANRHAHRATLIPNGVDPDIFRPMEPGDPRPSLLDGIPRGRVVLMAAALIDSKRVAEGIAAVARVEDAFLVVVGDGPLRSKIAALASGLLPGRHALLGSVPRELMPAIFRHADAFLHMSRDEPFGIVYLEAGATALPVVAHDGPVPRWILGEAALFADTADLDAVANCVERALDRGIGPSLGEEARRRIVDGWTWRAQADRYLDFFQSLCECGTSVLLAESAVR